MPDLKAAIARAKANGPRKVDVHQDHLTGKTVSKRSKTGNPACSAAMSAWKLGRGTPEVHAMLARCRAMAAGRRQAELSRAAGNEARAQHLEHRSKQGMTGKERLAKAKELAEKRKAGQAPVEKPAPIHRAPNDYEREALTKDRHTFLADQVVARTKTKAQRELTGGDGLIKTKEGYVPTRGGKPVSHYRPMDAAAAYDHMRRNGAGPLINQAESDRIDILTEFRKAGWKPQLPAQAEAPKLPTRTADTMSDAIAMSSPNGRMSKRAKAAATERLRVSLFGKEGLPQPSARQLSPAEADAQHAARLKELKEAKKRIKAGDARYDRLGVTGMANRGRARLERAARAAELRAKRKGKS